VAFRWVLRLGPVTFRAAAVPVAAATALLGVGVAAVAELLSLVAVLVAMLGAEARFAHHREEAPSRSVPGASTETGAEAEPVG
jgi:hypothetical protein